MDAFYTPVDVANHLVDGISVNRCRIVADFSCGKGSLLEAFERRNKSRVQIANDIDKTVIREVARAHPKWKMSVVDFLSAQSRRSSSILREIIGKVDVILLNPPFSNKGNTFLIAHISGVEIKCSRAAAFVAAAIPFLSPRGIIRAILPSSTLSSVRDSAFWDLVNQDFHVRILRENASGTFVGCSATSVSVEVSRKESTSNEECFVEITKDQPLAGIEVRVTRGSVEVTSELALNGAPVIHTTDLRECNLLSISRRSGKGMQCGNEPSVLLPRVGRPDSKKITLFQCDKEYTLSTCVLRIVCSSIDDATLVRDTLVNSWDDVSRIYSGTGASYTTKVKVADLLLRLGCSVV